MTKRLYFTDYTKTIYMMKAFGMKLDNQFVDEWYVAPESEYLFEAKKGDIGIRTDNDRLAIAKATEFETFEEPNFATSSRRYWKVIMRDNKLFFQPESE